MCLVVHFEGGKERKAEAREEAKRLSVVSFEIRSDGGRLKKRKKKRRRGKKLPGGGGSTPSE